MWWQNRQKRNQTEMKYSQVCNPMALKNMAYMELKLQNLTAVTVFIVFSLFYVSNMARYIDEKSYGMIIWKSINEIVTLSILALYYKEENKQRCWQFNLLMAFIHSVGCINCFDFDGFRFTKKDHDLFIRGLTRVLVASSSQTCLTINVKSLKTQIFCWVLFSICIAGGTLHHLSEIRKKKIEAGEPIVSQQFNTVFLILTSV